jgi:hypothetical protein
MESVMAPAKSCFTCREVLKGIGRSLLARFLDSFTADLAATNIALPRPDLSDDDFFAAVAAIFALPENLPARVREALAAIDELANPAGRHKLLTQLSGLPVNFDPRWSDAQCAIEAWLMMPGLIEGLETYTLDPLRTHGRDALIAQGIKQIKKIQLQEVETVFNNLFKEVHVTKAADVFHCASADGGHSDPIPEGGTLTHAAFVVQIEGSPDPCTVDIRPPNAIILGHNCDTQLIQRWLSESGFRIPTRRNLGRTGQSDAQTMVLS